MIFYHVIQNIAPGSIQFVESTISGYCIFTKWESRAKLFSESEASELVDHLTNRKPKNHYAKIQTEKSFDNITNVSFTIPSKQASDFRSDPGEEGQIQGKD